MISNRLQLWFLALPGVAVCWQFLVGNWLNSPRCLTDALLQLQGGSSAFSGTPYWAKFTFCVDPYWVNQWLKNYGGGYVKRGLIGSVLTLFGDRFDLVLLNVFALLLLFFSLYALVFLVARLLGSGSLGLVAIAATALWMSSFGKVFSETAGDPLQVVLCVWLLFACCASLFEKKLKQSDLWRDCVVSLLYIVSILIYEGSFLLLFVPFCVLGRRTWLWLVALFGAVLLVWSMAGSEPLAIEESIADALVGFNSWNGLEVSYRAGGGIASQVSFMDNFWMELARYQENPRSVLSELQGALSVFTVWIMIGLGFVLSGFECREFSPDGAVWRFSRKFFWLLLANLLVVSPFLFVTHDWVRYLAVVSVLLVIVVCVESQYFFARPALSGLGSAATSWLFLAYSFAVSLASCRLGPFDVDIRTSLPADSRMPFTLLSLFAVVSASALLSFCFRRNKALPGI